MIDEQDPKETAWLRFTDGEYYHRVRQIMLDAEMGEGDVEMILANIWEDAYSRAMMHYL